MKRDQLKRELAKYPKEVLIKVFMDNCFFDGKRLIRDASWEHIQSRFDALMAKSKELREEMEPLINKKDFKSLSKYIELMNEDSKVHKKIDSVMKEMDKFNS